MLFGRAKREVASVLKEDFKYYWHHAGEVRSYHVFFVWQAAWLKSVNRNTHYALGVSSTT